MPKLDQTATVSQQLVRYSEVLVLSNGHVLLEIILFTQISHFGSYWQIDQFSYLGVSMFRDHQRFYGSFSWERE